MLASRRSSLEASLVGGGSGSSSHLSSSSLSQQQHQHQQFMEFVGQPQETYYHPSQIQYQPIEQSSGYLLTSSQPSFGPYSTYSSLIPSSSSGRHLQHHHSATQSGVISTSSTTSNDVMMPHHEDERLDMMMNSIAYAKESWFILQPPSSTQQQQQQQHIAAPNPCSQMLQNHFDTMHNIGNTNHYLPAVSYPISSTPPPLSGSGPSSTQQQIAMQQQQGNMRPYKPELAQYQQQQPSSRSYCYSPESSGMMNEVHVSSTSMGDSTSGQTTIEKSKISTPNKRTSGMSLTNPKRSRARTSSSSEESGSVTSGESAMESVVSTGNSNENGSDKGIPPMPPHSSTTKSKSSTSISSTSKSISRPKKPSAASRSSSTGSVASSGGKSTSTSGASSSVMTISSTFRGVSVCGKDRKFQARIRDGAKVHYLGRFSNELDAALQYDKAAREYKGNQAVPNFVPMSEATERALKKSYSESGRIEPEFQYLMLANNKTELAPSRS